MLFTGISLSPGIAYGKILRFAPGRALDEPESRRPAAIPDELARLDQAVAAAGEKLAAAAAAAERTLTPGEAEIFQAQQLMLTDPALLEEIKNRIVADSVSAVVAAEDVIRQFELRFRSMPDEYFQERAADIRDIGGRLLRELTGSAAPASQLLDGCIIVAEELTPSDTLGFMDQKIAGIATERGGRTSHVAVLARAMGVPAVSGLAGIASKAVDGAPAVILGAEGRLLINPEPESLKQYSFTPPSPRNHVQRCANGAPAVTMDGRRIEVMANISGPAEAQAALDNGADGIGLMRTEFLLMNRQEPPAEEEQFGVYKEVLTRFQDKPVTIRTFDIGGDKAVPFFHVTPEANPFLGLRGLRLSLTERQVFRSQLRALLRASVYGNLRIMFPMVATLDDYQAALEALQQAQAELSREGAPFRPARQVGMMVEVPAAALMADTLIQHADFFSIGTNDLTQYTLAVDRGNEAVAGLYSPYDPAVLKMMEMTVAASQRRQKCTGVCGEMAGEPEAAPLLIGMGIEEVSMSPVFIPQLKQKIKTLSFERVKREAARCLSADNTAMVKRILNEV